MFRQPPPFVLKFRLELCLLKGIWVMEKIKGESCWKRLLPVLFANLWVVVVVARAGEDSSHNLILCDEVISMQWGYGTILTA